MSDRLSVGTNRTSTSSLGFLERIGDCSCSFATSVFLGTIRMPRSGSWTDGSRVIF